MQNTKEIVVCCVDCYQNEEVEHNVDLLKESHEWTTVAVEYTDGTGSADFQLPAKQVEYSSG